MPSTILAGLLALIPWLPAAADTLSVQVRDRVSGAPVPGAIVIVVSDAPIAQTLVTDEFGEAHTTVASTPRVSLAIRSPKHGMRCFTGQDISNGMLAVDLDPSARLQGVVRDAAARPISGAIVRLAYEEDRACRVHIPPPPIRADEHGQFVLRNVDASRRFTIAFEQEGYVPVVLEGAAVMGVAVRPAGQSIAGRDAAGDTRGGLNVTLRRP